MTHLDIAGQFDVYGRTHAIALKHFRDAHLSIGADFANFANGSTGLIVIIILATPTVAVGHLRHTIGLLIPIIGNRLTRRLIGNPKELTILIQFPNGALATWANGNGADSIEWVV